jgi:hypothetical protein
MLFAPDMVFGFAAGAVTVLGGISLTLYLYFSDGPVLSSDKSVVKSDDDEDE